MVKGVKIVLDPIYFREILHLPCEGYSEMELPNKENEFRRILESGHVGDLSKLDVKLLSIEMRLPHHMVTNYFFQEERDMIFFQAETFV